MLTTLAKRISRTKLGQRAMAQPEGWEFIKQKPTPRFYVGLGLIIFSYLISLPAFAFCGYLSVSLEEPWIAVIGVPVIFIVVHLIFVLGAWLAGGNYAVNAFLLTTKLFLHKFGKKKHTNRTPG